MANGGIRALGFPCLCMYVSGHASHEAWVTTAILVSGHHGPVGND